MENHEGPPPLVRGLKQLSSGVAGLGILIPALVLGAIFLGIRLDRIFGTTPWLTIGLILLSIPAMILLIIRVSDSSVGN